MIEFTRIKICIVILLRLFVAYNADDLAEKYSLESGQRITDLTTMNSIYCDCECTDETPECCTDFELC